MGGHTSKQSIKASTSIAANIVQNTAQNCINVSYGGNTFSIDGNYNDISGVSQTVSVAVSAGCSTFAGQNTTFSNDLSHALTQFYDDQEVALTQWLDNSRDDQETNISQSVTANFTQSAVQSCVNNLNNINIFSVTGNGNVVKDVTQTVTLNVLSQCLLQNGQTNDVVSTITNTINQHGTYTSENPLAFITDAIGAVAKSALAVAAVIFIVIVCFVFLFMLMRRSSRQKDRPEVVVAPPAGGPPFS